MYAGGAGPAFCRSCDRRTDISITYSPARGLSNRDTEEGGVSMVKKITFMTLISLLAIAPQAFAFSGGGGKGGNGPVSGTFGDHTFSGTFGDHTFSGTC